MVRYKLNLDTAEFKKSLPNATKEIIEIELKKLNELGEKLKADAVKEAPSDTGRLRASMVANTYLRNNTVTLRIGNLAEYSVYVHQGTGKFAVDGNGRKTPWTFQKIEHGKLKTYWTIGQKPNPFLERAIQSNITYIKNKLGIE